MVFARGNRSQSVQAVRDLHPTPSAFTNALLDRYILPSKVWEPACGDGAMADVLKARGYFVTATDIESGIDFLSCDPPPVEAIVTNPPYSLADQFAVRALRLVPTVALLLPLNNLTGQKRYWSLWETYPPTWIYAFGGRMNIPSYEQGVSHNYAFGHMWVVWEAGHTGAAQFEIIPPEETDPSLIDKKERFRNR